MHRFILPFILLLAICAHLTGCGWVEETVDNLMGKASKSTEEEPVRQEPPPAPPEPEKAEVAEVAEAVKTQEPEEPQGVEEEDEEAPTPLSLGERGVLGGVEINITKLDWHKGDKWNHPGDGESWLAIEAEINNPTDKNALITAATNFELLNENGEKMSNLSISPVVEVKALAGLSPGERNRGWLVFVVSDQDDTWTLIGEERSVGLAIENPDMIRYAIRRENVGVPIAETGALAEEDLEDQGLEEGDDDKAEAALEAEENRKAGGFSKSKKIRLKKFPRERRPKLKKIPLPSRMPARRDRSAKQNQPPSSTSTPRMPIKRLPVKPSK